MTLKDPRKFRKPIKLNDFAKEIEQKKKLENDKNK